MQERARVDWYFDVISPYAYLQAEQIERVAAVADVHCKPLLFAGLLNHWGQLGPAEIEPKRRFTFRYAIWRGARLGLEVRPPPAHPFNPLKLLRLAIVLRDDRARVLEVFRFVWRHGKSADDPQAWAELCERVGMPDAEQRIAEPAVKDALRANGEEAIARGVFGVPTLVAQDGELFWGDDATDMLLDYLRGDALFASEQMRRADTLPMAASRR